jgi:hypothetical protein
LEEFATRYLELEGSFRRLALADDVLYVPNPRPVAPSDYVFIAMEPSTSGLGSDTMASWVAAGYRNFRFSIDDFCLHFVAREYLCAPGQTYHITDISKGAGLVRGADSNRRVRWGRWYPLLQREIELVAKPDATVFTLGGKVTDFLTNQALGRPLVRILHFSASARGARKLAIVGREAEFEAFSTTVSIGDIRSLAETILIGDQFPPYMQRRILEGLPVALARTQKELLFAWKIVFDARRGDRSSLAI